MQSQVLLKALLFNSKLFSNKDNQRRLAISRLENAKQQQRNKKENHVCTTVHSVYVEGANRWQFS